MIEKYLRPQPVLVRQGKDYLITVRLDYVRRAPAEPYFVCLLFRHEDLVTGTTTKFFDMVSLDGDYYGTLRFTGVRDHTNYVVLSHQDSTRIRVTRADEL